VTAPLLIFIISGFTMVILGLLRKNFLLSAMITGIFALVIALFAIFVPLDEALNVLGVSMRFESRWIILGRSFLLDSKNRASIGFIFLSGGFILFGAWSAKPERMFFSLGIGTLTLVAASLMIEPFLFAAIFIELAVITASIILSSRKGGKHRGGLRLLVIYTIAMLAILLVGWLLDVNQQEFELQGLSIRAAFLLGFGFAVLLAIPPFHSWIPIASGENHPFTWTFISIVLQGAGFFFILRFMSSYIWLNENMIIYGALRTIGATMAIVGALWAFVQNDLTRMASYALIADLGVMLIAFGVGSEKGFQLALVITVARVVSLACLAQGLNKLQLVQSEDKQGQGEEEGNLSIIAIASILVGMISLAGFPLTAGFPGRWEILRIIAPLDNYAWIALLSSMGILGLATIRSAKILLKKADKSTQSILNWTERIYLGGGILLTLIFGLFPQIIYPWIVIVIEGIVY